MNISESWLDIYEYSSWMEATFIFIYDTLKQFFSVIFSRWLFWFPMLAILLLGLGYVAVWLVLETTNYTHGSNYANPNRQFGRMANPNRQYETKMPLWSAIGQRAIRTHRLEKERKEREDALANEAYEKIVEEQEALENKHRIHEMNQAKANAYFKHNQHAFKINIDGETFWRDGWEKTDWQHFEDNAVRISQRYEKVGDKYKLVKENYHRTKFDNDPEFTKGFAGGENRSFDLDDALSKALADSKRRAQISVQVDDDE